MRTRGGIDHLQEEVQPLQLLLRTRLRERLDRPCGTQLTGSTEFLTLKMGWEQDFLGLFLVVVLVIALLDLHPLRNLLSPLPHQPQHPQHQETYLTQEPLGLDLLCLLIPEPDLVAEQGEGLVLETEELVVDDSTEPLRMQAEAFRKTVVENAPPVVSAAEGLAAVEVANDIVESVKQYRWDGKVFGRKGLDVIQKEQ